MKALCCAVVVACLLGCGGNSESLSQPTELQTKAAADLKPSRDQFAFRLKDELLKQHAKDNVCFSPLSIQLCLSMLLNGADGDSADQLKAALFVDKQPIATVNDANYTLLAALLGDSFAQANSIWLKGDVQAKPAFTSAIDDTYRADFYSVKQFDAATVKQINEWTSKKTKDRIPTLLKELDPATSVVLVNALTFDGKWAHPFKEEQTQPADFKLLDGKSAPVPTMHQHRQLDYAELNGAKALKMNYVGDKFSMVFILPPDGTGATAYLGKLKPDDLGKILLGMRESEVDVALPKFELRSCYDLKDTLSAMGLAKLFTHIDLSNIGDSLKDQTYISQVVHQTLMKVDEEGTEAAAATDATVATTAIPMPAEFHADRPFVYALMHNETKAVVFLGVVNDPRG